MVTALDREKTSGTLTVAVIGAGRAGRQFALACAGAGFATVLEDVMPAKLRHAEEDFRSLGMAIQLVSTVEDAVRDADVVVDFVPDELESKLEIWSMIDRMAPPRTVMCTPSQELSITDLASCTYRADRAIMVRGALDGSEVRLLSAADTTDATRVLARRLFTSQGKRVLCEADPDLPQLLKNMRAETLA